MPTRDLNKWGTPPVLFAIFVLLIAGILMAGGRYFRNYERHFRAEAESQLSVIAELKVDDLAQYRKERLGDAATFLDNKAFSRLVRRFFEHPEDADAQQQVQEWAVKFLTADQYDLICLFDAQGVVRLSAPPERSPISSFVVQHIPEVLQSDQVAFQDFHRNEHDQRIYLTLMVPIFDGPDTNRPLGVLALRIDPETYLYPFIKRWPTPSRTAETLLVRRDGNDVLFLNELKFRTNTALNLRISLNSKDVAAVKALFGEKGIVKGVDYRGVPTLAALKAVPDSPWFLVAKMDMEEVYASVRERLWLTIFLVSLSLISAVAGIVAIWRYRHSQFYKERYKLAETLRASETRYRRFFETAKDGILILDAVTGKVVDVNPFLTGILGFAHKEFLGQTVWALGFFKDIIANQAEFEELQKKEYISYGDLPMQTSDGRQIRVEFVSNVYQVNQRKVVQCNIRDITERKLAEETIARERQLLRTLIDRLPETFYIKDLDSRFLVANEALAKLLGKENPSQVLGLSDADLYPAGLAAEFRAEEMKVFAGEPLINQENTLVSLDGREHTMLTTKLPFRDSQGRICGLVGIGHDITERKRMEESLRHEQALMATLMDNVPAAIYFKDAASRFLRVNRAHSRTFGLNDPARLVGKADADFFVGEHARQALADEQKIIHTGQPLLNVEEKETWLDGTVSWVLTTKLPLRDAAGRVIGTCGISLDITNRKEMEQALAERTEEASHRNQELAAANTTLKEQIAVRERIEQVLERERNVLRTLIDNLPDYVYAQDAEGRFVVANLGMAHQLGFSSPNEVIGKSNFDLFPRELAEKYHADEREIIRSGKGLYSHEGPTMDASKEEKNRWVSTTKVPLRNDLGEITGFVGLGQDITERKRAEEALLESQALYYSFVEQLPVGVFRKDREGRFILVNPWFCQFKGMKPADFLGKTIQEVAASEAAKSGATGPVAKYVSAGADHHQHILQTGERTELVEEYVWADGRRQYLHVIKLPVVGPNGKIIGTQGVQFDITERKLAEEALQQSSKELQERNDELARFTYTASHDLKSPLVTVQVFLGYLEQDTLNQDAEAIKKDRQYIYSAVDKMTRLLDDLLALARVGHKINPPEAVPLQAVVKDALDMVAGWIIQKGVEMVVTKEPIVLCGDRTRLVEVFQNLVDNAIKFMGDQPNPRVEIGVEQTGKENAFFVRDNGIGIDPRYQPKVFGLFEKFDPGTKGSGIGLALVKRIVEVHGGKIWVESAGIGKGATFRFTLAKTQRPPAQLKSNEHP
jgi:PAS domain S-box-containing protein